MSKNPLAAAARAIDRVSIGRKLFAAFAAVLAATLAVAALGLYNLAHVQHESTRLAARWLQGTKQLAQARAMVVESREYEIRLSRSDDPSYHAEYKAKLDDAAGKARAALAAYGRLDAAADAPASALDKAWAGYTAAQARVIGLATGRQKQDAVDISDGLASMAFDETMTALDAQLQRDFAAGDAAAERSRTVYAEAFAWMGALSAGTLLLGVALAWSITRSLTRQLGGEPRMAAAIARAVAGGDLTSAIPLRAGDRDSLMASLAAMQGGLAATVTGVRSGAERVALASEEIAQGNQDLSDRTEQQATALQETAATMTELDSTVRNNAGFAAQANQLAHEASAVAVKGGGVVDQVVDTMRGINASSKQIVDIVSVINGIAFQTNILALNAAVEAARAGEQGRGFAVVAGEVQMLARRSASAAKEIEALISSSVERVDRGTRLVDLAGRTMSEIVAAIRQVSNNVAEISEASVAQSSGVQKVGRTVTRMDAATQQNSALVEQSAAAAEMLRQQSQQLVQAVAVFKVRETALA